MNTEDSVDYFALQERVKELEEKLKDAVEVVRCKDCKYRGIIDYPVCCESTDEWFCAAGERREESEAEE